MPLLVGLLASIGLARNSALTVLFGGLTVDAHAGRWLIALGLVSGIFNLAGRAIGAGEPILATFTGAKIAWPAALVLSAVALADLPRLQTATGGHSTAGIVIAAALTLAVCVDRKSPTRIPVLAMPLRVRGRRPGVWEIALLGVSLAVLAVYLRIGASAEGNFQNDSAYYYGVARHIATTKRLWKSPSSGTSSRGRARFSTLPSTTGAA